SASRRLQPTVGRTPARQASIILPTVGRETDRHAPFFLPTVGRETDRHAPFFHPTVWRETDRHAPFFHPTVWRERGPAPRAAAPFRKRADTRARLALLHAEPRRADRLDRDGERRVCGDDTRRCPRPPRSRLPRMDAA